MKYEERERILLSYNRGETMGITLKKLTAKLKDLQIERMKGAHVLLRGVHLLVDHAASPWVELMNALFPPAPDVIELLQALQLQQPNFDLDTCAALAIQQAYLQVLQTTLRAETGMLEARFDLDEVQMDEHWRKKFAMSVEALTECEITTAQMDIPNLHNEPLMKNHLEQLTADWLRMRLFRGADEASEAANFARRISYQVYPQLLEILADNGELYAPLAGHLKMIDFRELRESGKYRTSLLKLPLQPMFHETFALRDVYVELNATTITRSGQYPGKKDVENEEPYEKGTMVPLMHTVRDQLEDREHVVFIQAEPGKGKSVFCQMLAARVASEYPDWVPILIRLRDERFVAEMPVKEAFQEYLKPYFTLTDEVLQTRRFLFILDGFDELQLSADSGYALKSFFERLSSFQKVCAEESRWRHKIVITGRPIRIQDIESELPSNFLRLQIEHMENPQFVSWLRNWAKLFGEETAEAFRGFLEKGNVFAEENHDRSSLRRLASEPLLLYLLGAMHRDGALPQDVLDTPLPRIAIYDRLVSWVCGDTRKYHAVQRRNRLLEKSSVRPYELRRLLQELALCVWHSGKETAPMTCMTKRLNDAMPEQMKKLMTSGFDGVHNVFIACSFQPQEGERGKVAFLHKSFGEYLTAERMVEILRQIGEPKDDRLSNLKEVAHRFYAVFGVALLTDEIRDFVMAMLTENLTHEELKRISRRLYHVYIGYSDGCWMDEGIARTQWDALKRYGIRLGLFPFEVQAGINLFVLLCLLYQHTDGTFEVCGREADGTFDPNRFRKLFGLGEIVGTFGLFRRIQHLLKKVSLPRANLLCLNLRRANLQGANLQGAVLRDSNLRGANLQGANLQGADLRVASLQDADLRNADLRNANLEDGDLRDTDLRGANLQGADLLCADLRSADLQGAALQKAVFYGANLQGAILQDADVAGAIISKQHLARYRDLFSADQFAQLKVVVD